MTQDPQGRHVCGIQGTTYRGEEHSIWLRTTEDGYQVVDLDLPAVYELYLRPNGAMIPIFALIAVLYPFAPVDVYPARHSIGIPDFAADFAFTLDQVQAIFDCDPDSVANALILSAADGAPLLAPTVTQQPAAPPEQEVPEPPAAGQLPALGQAGEINDGVGAELAVAADLGAHGWHVTYRGNQRGIGYDLEASHDGSTLRVEVKSSVSFTAPELQQSEWDAAQRFGDEYILGVVDFYGSEQQRIWYVRDPAANAVPVEKEAHSFRFVRNDIHPLSTDAQFL